MVARAASAAGSRSRIKHLATGPALGGAGVGVYVLDLATGASRHVVDGVVGQTPWTGGVHPCLLARWTDDPGLGRRDPGCGVVTIAPR